MNAMGTLRSHIRLAMLTIRFGTLSRGSLLSKWFFCQNKGIFCSQGISFVSYCEFSVFDYGLALVATL